MNNYIFYIIIGFVSVLVQQAHAVRSVHFQETLPRLQVRTPEPRIINGRLAEPGEFPYQLEIRYLPNPNNPDDINGQHLCGATLVLSPTTGRQIAITVAHFAPPNTEQFEIFVELIEIRAGIINLMEGGQSLRVIKIVRHPEYGRIKTLNGLNIPYRDITVLQLNGSFELGDTVMPLALPKPGLPTKGLVRFSGWGATDPYPPIVASMNLMTTDLQVIDSETCNYLMTNGSPEQLIFDHNICAWHWNQMTGPCTGDSGSSLAAVENGEISYLAGFASWRQALRRNCDTTFPAVYERVSSYIDWIDQVSMAFDDDFSVASEEDE